MTIIGIYCGRPLQLWQTVELKKPMSVEKFTATLKLKDLKYIVPGSGVQSPKLTSLNGSQNITYLKPENGIIRLHVSVCPSDRSRKETSEIKVLASTESSSTVSAASTTSAETVTTPAIAADGSPVTNPAVTAVPPHKPPCGWWKKLNMGKRRRWMIGGVVSVIFIANMYYFGGFRLGMGMIAGGGSSGNSDAVPDEAPKGASFWGDSWH